MKTQQWKSINKKEWTTNHNQRINARAFMQKNEIARILNEKMNIHETEINFPPEIMGGLGQCYHSLMKATIIDKVDDIEFLTLIGDWNLLK